MQQTAVSSCTALAVQLALCVQCLTAMLRLHAIVKDCLHNRAATHCHVHFNQSS